MFSRARTGRGAIDLAGSRDPTTRLVLAHRMNALKTGGFGEQPRDAVFVLSV